MSRILGSILLSFLMLGSAFAITTDTLSLTGSADRSVRLELQDSRENGQNLSFELPELLREEIGIEDKVFQLLSFEGAEYEGADGRPALPIYSKLVAVPDGMSVNVRVVDSERESFGGYRILPMQPEQADRFFYDADFYSREATTALPTVEIGEPGIMHGLRVVPLTVRPLEFDPVSGEVTVTRRMELALDFTPSLAAEDTPRERNFIPESFADLYREHVVDGDRLLEDFETGPGTYLMIYANVTGVAGRLDSLIEWRQKQGYNVIAVSTGETGGNSTTAIKNYIQNIYNTVDPPLEFVSLVGDANGSYPVATYYENIGSGYDGMGDHDYTTLEGGDILPDVHVGRISIGSLSDLTNIVSKMLGYEKRPPRGDSGWFNRACLVGDTSPSGITCIFVNQWTKHILIEEGWTQIDTIWSGSFAGQMVGSMNQGMTWFSYRGYYGNSGYTTGHASSQTNGHELPFVVDITCDTGTFSSGTALSEAFLRAPNGGGIGAIGTATTGTHTRYNNAVFNGIAYTYIKGVNYHMGAALTGGKLSMYTNYYPHSSHQETVEEWMIWNNLMGDPAVDLWTDYPVDLDVNHPGSLHIGANVVPVTVSSGGQPVEGARVALFKDGDVHSVALTDAFGEALVPLDASSQGTLYVTVTGHNLYPYQGSLALESQAIFVALNNVNVDGDGRVNPDESIALEAQLYNFGSSSAAGVTALLSENDPYVTITDGSDSYGTIASGSSSWGTGGYAFTVSADAPDDHLIQMELRISSGITFWTSIVQLSVESGEFEVTNTSFSGPGGNLDPGESGSLTLTIRNDGSIATGAISAVLSAESPWINVSDPTSNFPAANVGASVNNSSSPFSIAIAYDCFEGHLASFSMELTYNSGAVETVEFVMPVGSVSSNDPVGPDAYGYYAFDNTDTSYPYAATYDWVEIDPNYGGPGSDTGLYDFGWEQDDVRQYNLPFDFQFYGETFDRVSICSNGWLSFGEFDVPLYRNWSVPSPGTPPNLVAVYWDNLDMSGSNRVYHWNDTSEHRYIVQWSRMQNDYSGATETVQVILYDPVYHPTSSGDGEILMQYLTVNQTDSRDAYGTVGIQNHHADDGLLYTFWNIYAPGAATLTSGRAIRFVPVEAAITGTLSGTVTNASAGDSPAPGVHVKLVEAGSSLISGEDGSFFGPVPIGEYTVVAEHASFEPDTIFGVVISEGQNVNHDFSLVDIGGPSISGTTVHPFTEDTAGPYAIQTTVFDYSPLDVLDLKYIVMGSSSGTVPMTLIDAENNLYEAEIPGQPLDSYVMYWVYARDTGGNSSTDPAGAPSNNYGFWVAQAQMLFDDDIESDLGWTVGDPADDASTGIWERTDPQQVIDGSSQISQPEDDHTPAPGVYCYFTDGRDGGSVGDYDVDNGQTTLYSPVFDLTENSGVSVSYWRWYINDSGSSPGTDNWRVQVTDNGSNWETLEYTSESDHSWVYRSFQLDGVIDMTSNVRFRFIASDEGDGSIVEAGVDDFQLIGFEVPEVTDAAGQVPERTVLMQNVPNPFNPKTEIRFGLSSAQDVQLRIFDVQGRLVKTLADGRMGEGFHAVQWSGRDESGRQMSSGVYFYVLQSADLMLREKMVLLK